MTKILETHGFINPGEEHKAPHFHNTDTLKGSYNIRGKIPIKDKDWAGKHLLFIPAGKIVGIKKRFRDLTIWYNGYSGKGMEYKVKKMPKG
jgi:hypothetical protein